MVETLLSGERLVMDALRNHSALVRSAKQDCRCELQMINRSFSPYVKPPFLPISDLLICNVAHLSSHTPLFSGFCCADGTHQRVFPEGFQLRVSCRSYRIMMGQVTHLAAPGGEATLPLPACSISDIPLLRSRVARDLSLAFFSCWNNKTATEPKQWGEILSFISELS